MWWCLVRDHPLRGSETSWLLELKKWCSQKNSIALRIAADGVGPAIDITGVAVHPWAQLPTRSTRPSAWRANLLPSTPCTGASLGHGHPPYRVRR
jgi:hypothetical protein